MAPDHAVGLLPVGHPTAVSTAVLQRPCVGCSLRAQPESADRLAIMPSWLVPSPENPKERAPDGGRPYHRHAAYRHVAEPNLILRATVGSTAHGLHLAGTDDRDEMGVCIEPPEYVIGLDRFEQWIYRTAEERAQHNPDADQRRSGSTPPSRAGDLDLVVYSLRKYARLAAAGNPTVLLLLYAEPLEAIRLARSCSTTPVSLPPARPASASLDTSAPRRSGFWASADRCASRERN